MTRAALAALLALGVGLVGCAETRPFVASSGDYGAYRATRVAPTWGERLAAAQRYVDERPDGRYAAEVSAYLASAEPPFFEARRESAQGLGDYLRFLPTGAHAAEAARRLANLRDAAREGETLQGTAASIGERLDDAARQRKASLDELTFYTRALTEVWLFTKPFSQAPTETVIGWTLSSPRPVCAAIDASEGQPPSHARRCAKILELPFTVPVAGVPEERQITLEIVMIQDAFGTPVELTFQGPALFARAFEAASVASVPADDTQAKARAFAAYVTRLRTDALHGADASACSEEGDGKTGYRKRCGGLLLRVLPSPGGAADDRVVLGAAPTP